jgi:molybdopterin biosynthesis enzyme MoaB
MPLRLAILTVSDAGSRGERSDSSGDLIAGWSRERGYTSRNGRWFRTTAASSPARLQNGQMETGPM